MPPQYNLPEPQDGAVEVVLPLQSTFPDSPVQYLRTLSAMKCIFVPQNISSADSHDKLFEQIPGH